MVFDARLIVNAKVEAKDLLDAMELIENNPLHLEIRGCEAGKGHFSIEVDKKTQSIDMIVERVDKK